MASKQHLVIALALLLIGAVMFVVFVNNFALRTIGVFVGLSAILVVRRGKG